MQGNRGLEQTWDFAEVYIHVFDELFLLYIEHLSQVLLQSL